MFPSSFQIRNIAELLLSQISAGKGPKKKFLHSDLLCKVDRCPSPMIIEDPRPVTFYILIFHIKFIRKKYKTL